jgi:hypothetical protein
LRHSFPHGSKRVVTGKKEQQLTSRFGHFIHGFHQLSDEPIINLKINLKKKHFNPFIESHTFDHAPSGCNKMKIFYRKSEETSCRPQHHP